MTRIFRRAIGAGLLAALCFAACGPGEDTGPPPPAVYKDYALVVSTLSNKLYSFAIDRETGGLTEVGSATFVSDIDARSLAIGPAGKFIYVVGLVSRTIYAFSIDAATGSLTRLPGSYYGVGPPPRTIAVGPSRRFAYVVSHEGETVSAFSINAETGALSVVSGSPFAAAGGPLMIVFEPTGRFAYVLNHSSESVSVLSVNGTTGALTSVAGPLVGVGSDPRSIIVDPKGKFVFVVNHDSDDISAYSIDAATGALTEVPGSSFEIPGSDPKYPWPESIAIDPAGRFAYVVNGSGYVASFSIDGATGALTPTGTMWTQWDSPMAMAVESLGEYAFIVYSRPSAYITAQWIDPSTGRLFPAQGSPGGEPVGDYAHAVITTRITQ